MTQPRAPLSSLLAPTPWLLLSLTILSWGGNVVAAKMAVGDISPMMLTTLRWFVVFAFLIAYARGGVLRALRDLRPHWRYTLFMGAVGYTASNAMFFIGARYTTGINIAIIPGVMPALVLIGVWLAYGVRIGALRIVGVGMTILGVAFAASHGDLYALGRLEFNRGDLMQLTGSILYSGFTVGLRKRPALPAFTFFIGFAVAAFVTSAPLLAVEFAMGEAVWPGTRGLAALFYVAVFTSIIGHIFWIKSVEIIGPSRAGVFQNLVPIVGAALSVLLLHESFEWYHGVALACVLGGIVVSEKLAR